MSKVSCYVCQKPKATLQCGICQSDICKYCAQFLDEDTFSFAAHKSEAISHTTYCGPCYDVEVAPILAAYNQTMEDAKGIMIFNKTQNKETRFVKRWEEVISVSDCADRNEAILRLAFFAAKAEFNAVIDIEVVSKKIRNGAYQTTKWFASGIPAHVNPDKLVKDRSFSTDPN